MKPYEKLEKMGACSEAVEWEKQFKTLQQGWDACERGDWLLWYAGKMCGPPDSKSRKKLVLCACKCARLSLKYVSNDEKRPLIAIQTAEKWAKGVGSVSIEDVRTAGTAAYAAAAAAYAAYAYAADAAAAAAADARTKTRRKCANIVRDFYPKVPREIGK